VRLRLKIPLLVLPLVILPLAVVGYLAYQHILHEHTEDAIADSVTAVRQARELIAQDIATARGLAQLLLEDIVLQKFATTADAGERYDLLLTPLLERFAAHQAAFPRLFEIRFVLPDGYEDARQTSPYVDNLSDDERAASWFLALADGVRDERIEYLVHPDTGAPCLLVATAVRLRNTIAESSAAPPTLRGYIVLAIDLAPLARLLTEAQIGASGYLLATDSAGEVQFDISRASIRPDERAALLAARARGTHRIMVNAIPTEVQAEALTGNLFVYAARPLTESQELLRRASTVVLGIAAMAVVVTGGGLVAMLAIFIVRPLQRLRDIARDIGCGQWKVESGITTADEVGELARAVEDMARNLEQADERVRYLAYHDNLTGLPNRVMFRDYLARTLAHAERAHHRLSLLFIDIDGFKRINDTLGHQAGDLLLKEIARRLSARLREQDMLVRGPSHDLPDDLLARLGGDEFIVLLTTVEDMHGPSAVARRLIATLGEPFDLNGQVCHVGASIGIALYPEDGNEAGELIKNADIAMYHAKDLGKNAYQFFQSSMNAAVVEQAALEMRLRRGIAEQQFHLNYQPQVDARSGAVVGFEALTRWTDPDTGTVSPGVFIPLAEETGLILPLGEWVIEAACRQARLWESAGMPALPISINVSGIQFERQQVADLLGQAIARHQLRPERIEIEITESAIMHHPERAVAALRHLKAIGVRIALDDFGTGYSSLSYLRRFPIDTLKIDRSFILEIDRNHEDAEIVAAIAAMAHTLGLRVVVEGVETTSQLDVIVEKGCDVVQGYVYHRPLAPAEALALLVVPQRRRA
jgi:diguanylate cyclase (GGDEF)-like protein